jgi:hypothetical protein
VYCHIVHVGQVGGTVQTRPYSARHSQHCRSVSEPIREVLESDESDVIRWWALDSLESARCGSPNTASRRTAVAFVIRAI